jgi:hypothetical protein
LKGLVQILRSGERKERGEEKGSSKLSLTSIEKKKVHPSS